VEIPLQNKVSIAMEIIAGMSFLSSHHIIHRDLASRNVLTKKEGERYSIKVGDFGLSRITNDDYYKASVKMFPYKWTAPESIKYLKFSSSSDIWSFGVTLWEICSDGEVPYSSLANKEILKEIEDGKRLSKPNSCPDQLYTIMNDCWKIKSEERPTWTQLFNRFKEFSTTIAIETPSIQIEKVETLISGDYEE